MLNLADKAVTLMFQTLIQVAGSAAFGLPLALAVCLIRSGGHHG
jgi:hypothetical protein